MTPYTAAVRSLGLSEHLPSGVQDSLKPGQVDTIARLTKQMDDFEFIVHAGDIAYADYWLKETVLRYINGTIEAGPKLYEEINEEFYDQIQPITSTKPCLIVAGNHEANGDNGGYGGKNGYPKYNESICPEGLTNLTNFTGFKNHWKMPSDVSWWRRKLLVQLRLWHGDTTPLQSCKVDR
jgi:hypothetical protein